MDGGNKNRILAHDFAEGALLLAVLAAVAFRHVAHGAGRVVHLGPLAKAAGRQGHQDPGDQNHSAKD